MFDNNFHYISIIVIRGEPVVSFTKLDLPKLFRNMITFNDCRMAVSLYVLINDQNIAILRIKSLNTDIVARLYMPAVNSRDPEKKSTSSYHQRTMSTLEQFV